MSFRELWKILLLLFGLFVFSSILSMGCSEKASTPQTNSGSSSDDDDDDDDDDDSAPSEDVCTALKDHSDLNDDFDDFIDHLCVDKKVLTSTKGGLRDPENVYEGGSKAKILVPEDAISEDPDEKTSTMRLYSSMVVPTAAESYYNMLRLQLYKPTDFGEKFEVSSGVKFEQKNESGATKDEGYVDFIYTNTSDPEADIIYKARSNFYVIKKDEVYVQTTLIDEEYVSEVDGTVLDLKAIVIVNKKSSAECEVFSMSDQVYDNYGDHDSTVERSSEQLKEEQKRQYGNGEHADDADKFFD